MSKMNFTPAQQDAIDADGGSVLVSAAAGSGKTRVLVQRVIRLLTDPEHPIDADRLLMVTFTKAAAEEMRARIASAIDGLLFEHPENTALRRQELLLSNADICTIHSFCSRMIRENFYLLDVNQDFRIASEGEAQVLRHRLMGEILEEQYTAQEEGFLLLSELLSASRSDKYLEKTLLSVYDACSAHPFPDQWLDMVAGFYDPSVSVEKSIFAQLAFRRLSQTMEYMEYMLQAAADVIEGHPAFCTGAATCGETKLNGLRAFFQNLQCNAQAGDWNALSDCITSFVKLPYRKPTSKKNPATEEECTTVKTAFDNIEAAVSGTLLPMFGIHSAVFQRDNELLYPAVLAMCNMLKQFDTRYLAAKKEKGVLDFSDLEHLMLQLLVQRDGSGMIKTEFARSLSARYDQIMVDEYQDTNETQETIFRYLSRDESNLFVVGDVKQSVYRFREAMPEIFKNRRAASVLYQRDNPSFPAKIILDKNFRSSEGVIDTVNFVFHSLMSQRVGEIDYNDEEKLTAGADYPSTDEPPMELHLLKTVPSADSEDEENEDSYCQEARYIAGLIREKLQQGMTVTDRGVIRPATYGDFAVLMRYVSSHGQSYADTLTECGIPAYIDKPYSLFGCYEVMVLLALLKMLDNPLQDIPMLSVLLCPTGGFTPDDLVELKSGFQGRFLYNKLRACAEQSDKGDALAAKCRSFFEIFHTLRKLAVTVSVSKLLQAFFDRTGYLPMMQAMENGDIRVKNIRKLMSFIRDYESAGRSSLTDFVRYLQYLEENGTDVSAGDTIPSNAVRIMSVHHSKGLEFPICILAGLSAKGNTAAEEVLCHTDLGFGFKTMDRDNLLKFNTLQRNVITLRKKSEEQSEAMRILYVAMTRAKEKLLTVISYRGRSEDSLQKLLQKTAAQIILTDGKIASYAVENASTLADWLLMCALVHPSMQQLRFEAGRPELGYLSTSSVWKLVMAESGSVQPQEMLQNPDIIPSDPVLLELLRRRFSTPYEHQVRTAIPSKVSASALVHHDMADYHIAELRPAFMQKDRLSGTEKGTAFHRFLQFADMHALQTDPDKEKQRLLASGMLTAEQAEAVTSEAVSGFVSSRTYSYMLSAQALWREYRFTVNLPASELDPSFPSEEKVILQGAIDCLIVHPDGLIIVDYKTDRVGSMTELAQRYARQLHLYQQAAEQLFEKPVKKCLIYSAYRAEEIELPS